MEKDELSCLIEEIRRSSRERNLFEFGKSVGTARYILEHTEPVNQRRLLQSIVVEEAVGLYHLREYEDAIKVINETIDLVEDHEIRLQLLHKKGAALAWLGQHAEALDIFEELTGEDSLLIRVYAMNSIAWVYLLKYQREQNQEYLDLAETYARDSIDYAKDSDKQLYAISVRNLANVYWESKKYEKALLLFLEVNELFEGKNPKSLNNVAATYVSLGKCDLAREYLQKAETIAEQSNNAFEQGQCYYIYGRIEEELLDQAMHAKDFYLAAFDYYIEAKAFEEAVKAYKRILTLDRSIHEDAISFFAQKLASQFKKEIA